MRDALVVVVIGALVAACGERREAQPARTEPGDRASPGDAGGAARDPAADATSADDPGLITDAGAGGAAVVPEEPDISAESAALGAIPVWQAVVDRDRYLLRRDQKATVTGRVGGEAIAPGARGVVRWLIDETEGNGALAIRMAVSGKPPVEGDRVLVEGAWALDNERKWYWQVLSIAPLSGPPPPAPPDPPSPPGHAIQIGSPPSGYRPVSKARDGGAIVFGVVRTATGEGDGWLIGDDSFSTPQAYLYLPGERPSYGGHDLRQDDERWVLKRGVTYWVRIDRVRRRTPTDLARIKAVTAPQKLW